jgi:hypothetical protein
MNNNFNNPQVRTTEIGNQAKLLIRAFGLAAIKPKFFMSDANKIAIEKATQNEGIQNISHSEFGLPLFDLITLKYNDDSQNYKIELGAALIDVSMTKNIVTTPIVGRQGTVKEYIADGDFSINIKGVLVNYSQEAIPKQDLINLSNITLLPSAIEIESEMLNTYWYIRQIVIMNFKINTNESMRNVINFEINAISEFNFD